MMSTSHSRPRHREGTTLLRRAAPPVAAAVLLIVMLGCRKGERAGPQPAAAPGSAPTASTSAVGSPPAIRDKAEPNLPPFSGLRGARDAAVDDRGRLWVADSGNSAVRVFEANGGYLGGWGNRGEGQYQLKDPCGIATRGGDVYVADTWNGRVQHLSLPGNWEVKVPTGMYGPRGIAVAPDGKIWITDTGDDRLVVCARDLSESQSIGAKGTGPEQFAGPIGIAVAASGRVYVADSANRRIQVLDPQGRFVAHWKFNGWGPNTEPYLEVDQAENVYATDPEGRAVVKLDRAGKEVRRWTEDGGGKKLLKPTGIALDEKNRRLLVVDSGDDSIAIIPIAK